MRAGLGLTTLSDAADERLTPIPRLRTRLALVSKRRRLRRVRVGKAVVDFNDILRAIELCEGVVGLEEREAAEVEG